MSGRSKKQRQYVAPFESRRTSGKYMRVCDDMMDSPAWKSLKPAQIGLYVQLKKKYTRYSNGTDNQDNISFVKTEAEALYGDARTFRKDIDALIEAGFIRLVRDGHTIRKPSIYGFSDRWKEYGTPNFTVPVCDRRPTAALRDLKTPGDRTEEAADRQE